MYNRPGYLLAVLVAVACVHNIDRMGFSIVLDSIKREVALSDTQLGCVAGTIFALLNAAAAIPVARLADRFGRATILALCITVWSGFIALSGLAAKFTQLVVARGFVGLADAGASPISTALGAAAYPPSRRPGMMAILLSGTYLGSVLGFSIAGLIVERLGWRAALIWMGMPGVILGVTVWLTLNEPAETSPVDHPGRQGWLADWLAIIRQTAFIDATLAVASSNILGWALAAWLPSFLLGQALGPLLVGFISDLSVRHYGQESLRFSLELASLLGLWPAIHLYRLARGGPPKPDLMSLTRE